MGNTNTAITAPVQLLREAGVVVTPVAFTEVTIDDTETLTITPTKRGNKLVIIISEVSGTDGTMTIDVAAGDYWAALAMTQVSVAQGTSVAIMLQAAAHKGKTTDTIVITITPASGKKIWTDHDATYQVFQIAE